jgi:hypothetical protein
MTCSKCKHWSKLPEEELEDNMGRCKRLSAPEDEDYPDIEYTGLDGYPLCWHDGGVSTVDTKGWFSCVHFDLIEPTEEMYRLEKVIGELDYQILYATSISSADVLISIQESMKQQLSKLKKDKPPPKNPSPATQRYT